MAERLPDWQTDVARLRDFAHVRLIVADLDGSLIHASAHVVYSSLTNLQRSLNHSHNRVAFTLATGRAWSGAKDLVDSLSIPRGTPLILYNGALTLECGTAAVIDKHCLSTQVIESVRTICSAHGATAYYYDFVDPIAALFQGKPAERVFGDGPVVLAIDFNGLEVQPYPTNVAVLMNCTAILVDVEQLGNAVSDIWKALSGVSGLMCTRSGTRYIEIRPPGVNKGAALCGRRPFRPRHPTYLDVG